ncbi:phosphotransferase [Microbacterium sp. NPDC055910]|uniref:phosphotransferase n=1 Tax=Microbacterium sp. NPDC055910 TaxID=3345659 RepID=UPI0035DB7A47
MARSPFTLAASITSALPRVGVVGVGTLTEGAGGRYDTAVADLEDGRRVVVRVPTEPAAGAELAAEARALRALTPGVRNLLPFRAPELLGETALDGERVAVVDFLPGYRVDPGHLPAGRGAATSLGEALAAVHSLPTSVVRTEGLPVRTPAQVRDDVSRLVDRAIATDVLPPALADRWRRALTAEELWHFESAVVLGGIGSASFLFEDVDDAPRVTGLLEWHGLAVGDPAIDLQWLATAPAAADDVYAAYTAHSERAPDARVRERARLYAELEFAKWLIHGHESERPDIVDDASALLDSLAASVGAEDLVADGHLDVDDAIALLDRMPAASAVPVDTSMQTDAYDPEQLSQWIADEDDEAPRDTDAAETDSDADADEPASSGGMEWTPDDVSTGPVDVTPRRADDGDAVADAERASDAALRRWLAD